MKVLLIDNGSYYIDHLHDLLESFEVISVEYKSIPKNYEDFDLTILSGTSRLPKVEKSADFTDKEIDLIKNSSKPVVGICYGCELIAYTFGCRLENKKEIRRIVEIFPVGDQKIFEKTKEIEVFESHKRSIVELSDEIEGIARSESGFEIIKHKTKPIWGLQFHPEMFPEISEGDEIFREILNTLK